MKYVDVNDIDKLDPEMLENIRTSFNNGFCVRFTDYINLLGYIDKSSCEKIKRKYIDY